MRKLMMAAAFALPMFGTAAMAQETVKIGYIDPLSGGGASVGEVGLKTFQFLADELNAKGGIQGKKVEIVPLDNKTNPQESLIQAQKAIDAGVRYHHPGQRLVGCRRADRLRDQVQRAQSRQGSAVLQLCRGRSGPDQRQVQLLAFPLGRELRHQDGGAHQLHEDACPRSKSVYLINQDYSFGESVRSSRQGHAGRQAAGHRDRRRRAASAAEGHRLRALHRQDQGIGRRHRHHRQLGPGFRAAAEGSRRRRTEGQLVHLLRRRHRRPDRRSSRPT